MEADPEEIAIGDIVQYRAGAERIIHRVVDAYLEDGVSYYVTRGDANPAADDPITGKRITGRLILVLPKIGWASIHLKAALSGIASAVGGNPTGPYLTVGIAPAAALAYLLHRRNQRGRSGRRRRS